VAFGVPQSGVGTGALMSIGSRDVNHLDVGLALFAVFCLIYSGISLAAGASSIGAVRAAGSNPDKLGITDVGSASEIGWVYSDNPASVRDTAFSAGSGFRGGECRDRPLQTVSTRIGRASVIDGDTLEIHGRRIRLSGIDSPERGQHCFRNGKVWRCGQSSALWLADLIGDRPVRCLVEGVDRFRRDLAVCYVDRLDLNGAMVRSGLALAFRWFSERYVVQEQEARRELLGLWAPGVWFDEPWDWRRHRRNPR
jgi:endonuclease YncB( thermonuclease family)